MISEYILLWPGFMSSIVQVSFYLTPGGNCGLSCGLVQDITDTEQVLSPDVDEQEPVG